MLEAEIHTFGSHITSPINVKVHAEIGEAAKEMVQKSSDNPRFKKRGHDQIVIPEKQKNNVGKVMSPPYKIQKGLKVNNSTRQQGYNSVPEGFT